MIKIPEESKIQKPKQDIRDFTAADKDSEEDNYEDDEYIKTEENETETQQLQIQTQPGQQQQLPILVNKMQSPTSEEIEEDYEF